MDVAIGIVGRPELLFLDEPTAGFDPHARREFHDLVHRLSDLEDTTIPLTTHDLDEAEKLADRVLILAGGTIIAEGSADALAQDLDRIRSKWSRDGQRFVTRRPRLPGSSTTCSGSTAMGSRIWKSGGQPGGCLHVSGPAVRVGPGRDRRAEFEGAVL